MRKRDKYHHFIELLLGMTEKELRARYKHTLFGFLWIILNPLLQMIVIGFVFALFIKEPIKNYYFYLFIGLLVWNFFTVSLTKATPSIVFERALVKKSRFPRSVIPLSIILSNFIHLILGVLIFTIPAIYFQVISLSRLPGFILATILLILFTCGLSLLTSALNVRYRDINFFVQATLIIWFYATPIVYSIFVIPRKFIWIWRINPLTAIIQLFQYVFADAPPPGPAMVGINTTIILLTAIIGINTFRKLSKNFDDWL